MKLHVTTPTATGSPTSWDLYTMAQPAVQSKLPKIASLMAALTWAISTGDGSPTNALSQGSTPANFFA